ncbi:MAG: glycine zipper 2TM domain-containing protein [Sterolibacterium sp.]|jgi:outer membrane lipoprotein SlyB|nr:glycine zipper 2TM domain-containing protein [Sterolibacterium sp.]MBP9800586.1 glycine zipper 2TM domain-containing protein [Sterolibacterium sp.]
MNLSNLRGLSRGLVVMAAVLLAGCAGSLSGSSYAPAQAQREMTVRMGVVDSVRHVAISGTNSGTGGLAGTAIGGIAGSNIGGGNRGSAVGAILGAVGGALAGHAIEEAATKKNGLEITVRFDNGNMSAITQEGDEVFNVGDRVRVLSGGGVTRVSH